MWFGRKYSVIEVETGVKLDHVAGVLTYVPNFKYTIKREITFFKMKTVGFLKMFDVEHEKRIVWYSETETLKYPSLVFDSNKETTIKALEYIQNPSLMTNRLKYKEIPEKLIKLHY